MSETRILVVDDDAAIRTVVAEALRRAGHRVETAQTIAQERRAIASFDPHVLVTDVLLPDGNALDVVPELLRDRPGLPVIVMSAQNTLTTAVRATERGAFDYLPKPFDLDVLTATVRAALTRAPREEVPSGGDEGELPLLGRSPAMQDVYRMIARVVPTELSVLILGESGTGKELVARALHDLGPRAGRPFVAINMAAIPRELIESELFGHERGAFTGAHLRTEGRFAQAAGGTLFLDEIGDMPVEAQTRLLRVLQVGQFTPVGSARTQRADVRIVAATHKNLADLVASGQFREDLYYRLNVVPIALPPLRRRSGDIALLARHFLAKAAREGLPRCRLASAAITRLEAHGWPGNVRELENLMRRVAVLSRDAIIPGALIDAQLGEVTADDDDGGSGVALTEALAAYLQHHFAQHGTVPPASGLYHAVLAILEPTLLAATMAASGHNQLRAARVLGINRNTLRKKLAEQATPQ